MNDFPLSTEENTSEVTPQAAVHSARPADRSIPGRSEYAMAGKVPTLRSRIAEAETQAILGALENTAWNRKRAAQLLAISYRGLLYKIRRHNIIRTK
jgi:transcriptional regulator with GAF, ATPase, and Fis domain